MQFEIEIKNYRCFSDERPARFIIQPGFIGFVGVNNSGKSSLMRLFYELRQFLVNANFNIKAVNIHGFQFLTGVNDPQRIFYNNNDRPLSFSVKSYGTNQESDPELHPFTCVFTMTRNFQWFLEEIRTPKKVIDSGVPSGLYLEPVINLLKNLANSLYVGPFRNAINIGTNTGYYDIQTGEAFIQGWRNMKTGNSAQLNEAALRLTKDIQQIFEFDQFEINASEDNKTLQLFINEKSYILPDIGSGITQFILVLANAAMKNPSYIFIDEPELNLHPSLQLDFLTTLGSYAKEGVIFATHNIGLARSVGDLIYGFQLNNHISEVKPFEEISNLIEFIGELSYSGYYNLGYNSVLLVEGVNEIKTVQQFLRMIKKDHRVLLIPLGGGSLINANREHELFELKRIPASNFYALIDSEKESEGAPLSSDHQGFCEVCSRAEIDCHVLDRRAFEHYLTEPAIQAEKGTAYRALSPYEKRETVAPIWAKQENWRIARRMDFSDIEATDLGQFLLAIK